MCFLFNDTATTEIYTYGNTLSLHAALPIYVLLRFRHLLDAARRCGRAGGDLDQLAVAHFDIIGRKPLAFGGFVRLVRHHALGEQPGERSEEHTSELQSLMRISYAVFCLKKKKNRKTDTVKLTYIEHI